MTCSLTRPSPQVLFDKIQKEFSSTVLGGAEIVPESNEWYVTSLHYAMTETMYALIDQHFKELDARHACCDNLVSIAASNGIYPRAASYATGYGKITGTPGSAILQPILLSVGDKQYRAIGAIPATMPSSGEVTLRFQAMVAGPSGNSDPTNLVTSGTIQPNGAGINTDVDLYNGTFCGGLDAEDCETFRVRYLSRRATAPKSLRENIRQIILDYPCVTAVFDRGGSCCVPKTTEQCSPLLEFYATFDSTFSCGLAPQCIIDEMNKEIFGEYPGWGDGLVDVGICGKIYTASPFEIDVVISGTACFSLDQKNEIKSRIADLFLTFAPSATVSIRAIEVVITQVVGYVPELDVGLSSSNTNGTILTCGDVEPNCDYRPCLKSIQFVDDNLSGSIGCTG